MGDQATVLQKGFLKYVTEIVADLGKRTNWQKQLVGTHIWKVGFYSYRSPNCSNALVGIKIKYVANGHFKNSS